MAPHGSLGLPASRSTKAVELVAPSSCIMASQALAFHSATKPRALAFPTFLHVAGSLVCQALAKPMPSHR